MKIKNIKEYRKFNPVLDRQTKSTSSTGSTRSITGYASIFNTPSKLIGEIDNGELILFYEIINPRAFDEILQSNPDVTYNIDHDNSKLVGRTGSNLSLSVDNYGLQFICDPIPDTTVANDLYTNIQAGLYFENSFCFTVDEQDEEWEEREDGLYRTINKVSGLYDVATCVKGAYANTTLSLRGLEALKKHNPVLVEEKPLPKPELDLYDVEIFLSKIK